MTEDLRTARRVRDAYARRRELRLDERHAPWRPENLFTLQARERDLRRALSDAGLLPLAGRRVLDVGCGDAAPLRDLWRFGASAEDLFGVDLLPDRLGNAFAREWGGSIAAADAQSLPFASASFDLTMAFTLLSSIRSARSLTWIALEMQRVTRPGGSIILYDFWTNPLNRDVLPLRRGRVQKLFRGRDVEFRPATLAPPLVRALSQSPSGFIACTLLEVLPFLKTHYIAVVRC